MITGWTTFYHNSITLAKRSWVWGKKEIWIISWFVLQTIYSTRYFYRKETLRNYIVRIKIWVKSSSREEDTHTIFLRMSHIQKHPLMMNEVNIAKGRKKCRTRYLTPLRVQWRIGSCFVKGGSIRMMLTISLSHFNLLMSIYCYFYSVLLYGQNFVCAVTTVTTMVGWLLVPEIKTYFLPHNIHDTSIFFIFKLY